MARKNFYKVIGIDVGNGYTNTTKVTFPTKVKLGANRLLRKDSDSANVYFNGDWYTVGQGNTFLENGRHLRDEYQICMLTAIAKHFPNEDMIAVNVCVGLPVGHYMEATQEGVKPLYVMLQEKHQNTTHTIKVGYDNPREVTIKIGKFDVFTEGAYPLLKEDTGNIVTIDVGNGTVNVTHFKDLEIVAYRTYTGGMEKLYGEVQQRLREQYVAYPVSIEAIESSFGADLIVRGNKKLILEDSYKVVQGTVSKWYSDIDRDFTLAGAKLYLQGGGGIATESFWRKHLPTDEDLELLENAQLVNAEIFEEVAMASLVENNG